MESKQKIVCVLYDDPVEGYPPRYAREDIPILATYRVDRLCLRQARSTSSLENFWDRFQAAWDCENSSRAVVTGWLLPPIKMVTIRPSKKEIVDADVVISQPFWPAYLTADRIAKAPNLRLQLLRIGSDHVDLRAGDRSEHNCL